jgi:TPR repeat protein
MAHKNLSLLLALSFILSSSSTSFARRAYSSYDYEHTKDTEIEYEPESVQTKNIGFVSDWAFLKTAEADPSIKDVLLKQADGGDVQAMVKLASMYFHGKGVERDLAESFKWTRQAAFKGNSTAQNNLGYMFDEGKGTRKDPVEALKWYRTSANFGCVAGQVNLGFVLERGRGLPNDTKDLKQANDWYQKAADQGNSVAKRNLYLFAQQGISFPPADGTAGSDAAANGNTTASVSANTATPVITKPFVSGNTPGANNTAASATAGATTTAASTVASAAVARPMTQAAAAKTPSTPSPSTATPAAGATATTAASKAPADSTTAASATTASAGSDNLTAGSDRLTALLRKMSAQVPTANVSGQQESSDKVASSTTVSQNSGASNATVKAEEKNDATAKATSVRLSAATASVAALTSVPSTTPTSSTNSTPAASTTSAAPPAASTPATASNASNSKSSRPVRDKWALVVGISDFENKGIPKLDYSSKDATDFYNYLVNESNFAPDHVRLLLNDKATFRRVMSELGSKFLARVAKPDDLVLLYFSTHGSPSQMDLRGKNYLVAYDSDPNDLFATGIEMQKIIESIQGRVMTDRVVMVLDACHSGFTETSAKGMGRVGNFNADELAQGSGQLVICSSQPNEQAWESTRYQNGVFTRKLLEGLRSKGPNTTLVDAYNVTKKGVEEEVREDRAGVRQTPVMKGKWSGNDLIVAIPPSAPQFVPISVKHDLEPDSALALRTKTKTELKISSKPSSKEPRSVEQKATKPVQSLQLEAKKEAASVIAKSKDPDSANQIASAPPAAATPPTEMVLTAKMFYPDTEARGLIRECFAALKSGNSHNPAEIYYMRAQAYIRLAEWNNAINDLTDAIHGTPNKAQFYLARAFVYNKMGQSLHAREDLDEAKFVDTHLPAKITFAD